MLEQDPDPTTQIVALQDVVNGLVDDGMLYGGQGNALLVKLNQALKQLEKGKPDQAITCLMKALRALIAWSGTMLPPAVAADLIARAQAIIAAIENS